MNPIAQSLRRQGYTGALSDAAAVRAFITDKNIEFEIDGKAVSIDDAVEMASKATKVSVTTEPVTEPDAEPADKAAPAPAPKRVEKIVAAPWVGQTPRMTARLSEAKAYNRDANAGRKVFSDADEAEAFRAWFKSTAFRNVDYAGKELDKEIAAKANVTTTFTAGGALVPEEFQASLTRLREVYGNIGNLAREVSMSGDQLTMPRRTGGLTVYAPGEGGAGTESNPSYDTYTVNAKKRLTITNYSSELLNDGAINIADEIANEIVYAFEKDLMNALILGDGTATYFKEVGYGPAFAALSGTIANIAGIVVGTGSASYSSLVLSDFNKVQGRLPDFDSISGEPVWFMNKRFYYETAARLALASGGVTAAEVNGKLTPMFLGSPVQFVRSMPRTAAASQLCAMYGWGYEAATVGRVNGSMEIATSADFDFDNDVYTVRGRHRAGVNVHDIGDASATEASRNPGPIVGLYTGA